MSARPEVWAVVPIKNTVDAKQRLADVLSAEHRQGLFIAMLTDVLTALAGHGAGRHRGCHARPACMRARARLAEIASEPANDGHTAAVTRGGDYVPGRHAGPAGRRPTQQRRGGRTGGRTRQHTRFCHRPLRRQVWLERRSPCANGLDQFAFGNDNPGPSYSCESRRRPAKHVPGFALDVDRPDDLATFAAQPSATLSYEYLRREELLGRLMS